MNDIQSSESKMKEFKLSNMKASINGIMFGGPKDFTMEVGQTIDWYLIAWGTDFDAFTISWTNAGVSKYNESVQQVDLLPASFATVRVAPVESGKSSFGCNIHSSQGLVMEFNVL
jgi:hypothetical protein